MFIDVAVFSSELYYTCKNTNWSVSCTSKKSVQVLLHTFQFVRPPLHFVCYPLVMDSNVDNEAPTVVCPTNETIEADVTQSTAVVIWNALATTDNSKLIPTVTCNTENGSQFEIGETEVICQAA